jgi:ribonuclease T1
VWNEKQEENTVKKRWMSYLAAFLVFCMTLFGGCGTAAESLPAQPQQEQSQGQDETDAPDMDSAEEIAEDGSYTSPEDVALYLHTYEKLPGNFITKKDAEALGWDSKKGNLWEVADGMSIGGDRFGNYEGLLPEEDGLTYKECDVNYAGGFRGAERIIFSNQGDIYYTGDHYESFEQLY